MDWKRDAERWLDTAVEQIRSGPDRKAVRAELAAHLEDSLEDCRRIFPDMTEEEARARALSGMGDAVELGRALAKIHKPWLGWLWQASRLAACLLAVALLARSAVAYDHYKSAGYPVWEEESTVYGEARGQSAELEGYTFQITGAAFLDYPEEDRVHEDCIQVSFRVSSPRFWERIDPEAVKDALTVADGEGGRYRQEASNSPEDGDAPSLYITQVRSGFFYREFSAYLSGVDLREGDRMTLGFDFEKGGFALTAGVAERVVMG